MSERSNKYPRKYQDQFFSCLSTLIISHYDDSRKYIQVVSETRSLNFVSLSGDTLMILENVDRDIKWSLIIELIKSEAWYQTCKRWKFTTGIKILSADDILESNDKLINITSIKIEPNIIFELPNGDFLVSIPVESCKSRLNNGIYVLGACFEAHKKLRKLGKDGYGTYRTKIHALIDTYMSRDQEIPCHHGREHPYIFRNKNGFPLRIHDVLEDPGDDNLTIVAIPRQIYCIFCSTKIYGPLRFEEQKKKFFKQISICSVCGFLHCPSCGMYDNDVVGTSECYAFNNM